MSRRAAALKPSARKERASPRAAEAAVAGPRPIFPPSAPIPLYAWPLLLAILAYGLYLQWPGLGNEIIERLHGWRQCQTAMTSRNFVRDGMNPLFARVDYIGDGQMQLELPVYQYLVSICYCIFGVKEVWGRIVALLFGMGSATVLFMLGRMLWSTRAGLLAAAVFSWSPLNVFFNRAFMPDSSTIFFALLSLWMFLLYFRDGRGRDLWIACVAVALALAGKPPIAVTVAPPLIAALFLAHGRGAFRQWRLGVGLAAAFAFFMAWMLYSNYINNHRSDNLQEAGLSFTNAGQSNKELMDWYFGSSAQRNSSKTYARIFGRVPDWVGHWMPSMAAVARPTAIQAVLAFFGRYGLIGLAIFGTCVVWQTRMQWVLPAWFFGCLAYVLIFLGVNFVHDYYQMPVVPLLALSAAAGVDRIAAWVAARRREADGSPRARVSLRGVLAGVLTLAFAGAQAYAGHAVLRDYDARAEAWSPGQRAYWNVVTPFVTMGKDIHKHLPDEPGLMLLAGGGMISDCRDPQLLYFIDRRGFVVQAPDEVFKTLDNVPPAVKAARRNAWVAEHFDEVLSLAIRKGARTLVLVYPGALLPGERLAALAKRHRQHYVDPAGQFAVYVLKP